MKMHFIKELEVPDYEEYFEDEIKRKATRLVFEMNVGNCYSFSKEIKKSWVRIDYIGYDEKSINSPNARHYNSPILSRKAISMSTGGSMGNALF